MRALIAVALLIYCVAHPAAVHSVWHLGTLAFGALSHGGANDAAVQTLRSLLNSHWH